MSTSKLVKNTFFLGIVQAVNYIFPLITVPYISRIIGPEGYGIFNYSLVFISYFTLLIAFGFDLTGTRRIVQAGESRDKINSIVSEVLCARLLLFVCSSLLFILALKLFLPIQDDLFTVSILFVGCIGSVISSQYIYQGLQELAVFAKVNFCRGFLNLILVFVLIKTPQDYVFLAVLNTFFLISINVFLFFYAIKRFNLTFYFVSFKKVIKIIFNERMVFFSTVLISLYTSTNTIVLGFFAEATEIGYYTTSQSFLNIVNSIIAMPLSIALFPFIGKSFSDSEEKGLEMIRKISPIVIYLTLGASIGLLCFAPVIIRVFYGNQFEQSIQALRILSFLPLIIGVSNILGIQLMLNMGLDKLFFKITFIASVFGIILNIYMSKNWGYVGTAWNCIIIECFVTMLMYICLHFKGIKPFDLKNFKLYQLNWRMIQNFIYDRKNL